MSSKKRGLGKGLEALLGANVVMRDVADSSPSGSRTEGDLRNLAQP